MTPRYFPLNDKGRQPITRPVELLVILQRVSTPRSEMLSEAA